jgi:hypothetical protein
LKRARPPASAPTPALDRPLLALERPGIWLAALVVGVALLLLASTRVEVGDRPTYLGKYYVLLASDPFHPSPDNPVAFRVLTPLVSWLFGLRGILLIVTNWIVTAALLGLAYVWFRREGQAPRFAFLGASILALSLVALTTLRYGGYTDATTYLLVFGAWWARRNMALSCVLFLMAMVNHESAAFLTPWLLFALVAPEPSAPRRPIAVVAMLVTLIAFAGIRFLQSRLSPATEYSLAYYLSPLATDPLHWFHESDGHRLLGIFSAFQLYWVLPLLAAFHAGRRRDVWTTTAILLPIPCALAQFLVAYDVSRMTTLAFMSVVLGAGYLLRTRAYAVRWWLLPLSLVNWFIPQVNVAMGQVGRMGR